MGLRGDRIKLVSRRTRREQEAMDACDSIHCDIKRIYGSATRPEWLRDDNSIYARADSIAWGGASAGYLDESLRQTAIRLCHTKSTPSILPT